MSDKYSYPISSYVIVHGCKATAVTPWDNVII